MKKIEILVLTMSFAFTFGRAIGGQCFKFKFQIALQSMCSGVLMRAICDGNVKDNGGKDEFSEKLDCDVTMDFDPVVEATLRGVSPEVSDRDDDEDIDFQGNSSRRWRFFDGVRSEVDRIVDVLLQDGPGFDTRLALDGLGLSVSHYHVREVLIRILHSINHLNKDRCARLGLKFFAWSGEQKNYSHTSNAYHLMMKIFADCEEFKAMWNLLDAMTESGLPTTAQTFNILICTCGEAGLARRVVERFIMSKSFNFRPFKHSFNAILHSLLVMNQYRLIEWVHKQMVLSNHPPDILTYNVLMCTKYKLGKVDQLYRLLDELCQNKLYPDLHTYNILLHVLGAADNPVGALNVMNHMKEVGCEPRVIHFTSLIDGLSRVGNLEACKYFFDEMVKKGIMPDVVCYTVMITGYVVARELEKAQAMFDEMIIKGQLPNVYTYNAMIRGYCFAQKYDEARSLLKEMESKGCKPNFVVYNTILTNLRKARKLSEAHEIMVEMVEKGHYLHLLSKFKGSPTGYRRC